MYKKLYGLLFLIALPGMLFAQSGELRGKVLDTETGEPVPFANVIVERGGSQAGGTTTDFDGNFSIKPLAPGNYNVKVSYVGYNAYEVKDVQVNPDRITNWTIKLTQGIVLGEIEVVQYKVPLIDKEGETQKTVTSEEIKRMPSRNVNSIAAQSTGVYQQEEGGALNIKGARSDATEYYIDGVKVRGSSNLPQSAIEQLTTVTGGIPAQYGDVTGGIINITTKGPSKEYYGGIEGVTSEPFDAYGYNLMGANLSGPVAIKDKGTENSRSVLGFFTSAELVRQRDPDPSAVGLYKVKDDVLSDLEQNPLRPNPNGGTLRNAEFVHLSDLEKIKARQNSDRMDVSYTGKLDFSPTAGINITFGGSGAYARQNRFIYEYSLFNPTNNPERIDNDYRVYGRFTQKFGNPAQQDEKSLIRNAYYSIQVDYSKAAMKEWDKDHQDRIWDYGYIGKFETQRAEIYEYETRQVDGSPYTAWYLTGYADTLVRFTPGEENPLMANYTKQYYGYAGNDRNQYRNMNAIVQGGGLINGQRPQDAYSLWFNTGRQFNGYTLGDDNQFSLNADANADIKHHALRFGVLFEQRTDRAYTVGPIGLWGLARQLANRHIQELDTDNPIKVYDDNGVLQDTIKYNRRYVARDHSTFDKNFRAAHGIGQLEFIDIDSYSPDQFELSYFSADELFNNGSSFVRYYGYDYLGNKLDINPNYFDYFTDTLNRPIGAFQPIYMAGYVQDKFAFKDITFNVGVRVDRYDANTKVLKDKYSMFDALTLGEVNGSMNSTLGRHPSGLTDDAVVYVNDVKNPVIITGYRIGDDFFDASGSEINGDQLLRNNGGPYMNPSTVVFDAQGKPVLSPSGFKDYEPQVTAMPRVAFSFPISDEANFYANYSVLTQRPRSRNITLPSDYDFLSKGAVSSVNNPNLRPEKITEYQLGFKQVVSRTSAISLTSFYREMRDNIQFTTVTFAYPFTYSSYENIDFGTVKGFTLAYDLRRTGNTSMTLSYTLQFADGTGSSTSSAGNLIALGEPNLRIPTSLDYDQRHTVSANLDYRYGSGKGYNGPAWGTKLLQNAGANLVFNMGSGVPYTRQSNFIRYGDINPDARLRRLEGSINGSRLPWQFRMDLKVDKDIQLSSKDDGGAFKNSYLNVYLQVMNLTDTRNVVRVYSATGNPDDDGFLASAIGQETIDKQTDPESFVDLYRAKINHPDNYIIPRLIRLGAVFNF